MTTDFLDDPSFDKKFRAFAILFHERSRKVEECPLNENLHGAMNRLIISTGQNIGNTSFAQQMNDYMASKGSEHFLNAFMAIVEMMEFTSKKRVQAVAYSSKFLCTSEAPHQTDSVFSYGLIFTFEPIFGPE